MNNISGKKKYRKDEQIISIIVPIYNVEYYLNQSIDRIVEQTYKNIEINFINNGLPIHVGKYVTCIKKDGRINVLHNENGGFSETRNVGSIAIVKYVVFVDSRGSMLVIINEELFRTA